MNAWTVSSCVAGNRRDELAQFWLASPDDILENLWHSPVGDATRELVAQLTPSTYLNPHQVNLREQLGRDLQGGLHQPGAVKKLIANFLYSPPGQLRIANAQANLPSWLVPGYQTLYEHGNTGLTHQSQAPVQPKQQVPASAKASTSTGPDFGAFPRNLQEFAGNRIQLNRLLGLSNLFYIDPEDQEILQELRQLRIQLSHLILECPEQELESLFTSDLGDRYWSMVRSGIQKENLNDEENSIKDLVTTKLSPSSGGGFGVSGALNAFLIAMAFYEPGKMQVESASEKMPAWLFKSYDEIFSKEISS